MSLSAKWRRQLRNCSMSIAFGLATGCQAAPPPGAPEVEANDNGACADVALTDGSVISFLKEKAMAVFARDDGNTYINRWNDLQGRRIRDTHNKDAAKRRQEFTAPLAPFRNASYADKGLAVDALVDNAITYVSDDENYQKKYGTNDHWATLDETIRNRFGDCDDYAEGKGDLLVNEMGVPENRVFTALVGSEGDGLDHAVVVLDISPDGSHAPQWAILTNNAPAKGSKVAGELILEKDSKYKFYYGFNTGHVWTTNWTVPESPNKNAVCAPRAQP